MDDKRSIAYVRKLKGVADHRTVFGECAEVVGGLFEFDVCLSLCIGITDAHNQQHHIKRLSSCSYLLYFNGAKVTHFH